MPESHRQVRNALLSSIRGLQFAVRQKVFGKIRLRRGLPKSCKERGSEIRFYEALVESVLGPEERAEIRDVWDIGCRNWSYARSLSRAFPSARINGVELDGGRHYWNFYRRRDFAEAFAGRIEREGREARCFFSDFRECLTFDRAPIFFVFFFPFVSETPCLGWGLPLRYVNFRELLSHARHSARGSRAGFRILSVHQGDWEAAAARVAWDELKIPFQEKILPKEFLQKLHPFPFHAHCFISYRNYK